MTNFGRGIQKQFSVLLVLIFVHIFSQAIASNSAFQIPRLIVVEKAGKTALFLPESHIADPSQFDRYFLRIIQPAFQASSRLFLERAEEIQLDETYRYRRCADEAADETAVDLALNRALQPAAAHTVWRYLGAHDPFDRFGRFMRVQLLLSAVFAPQNQPQYSHTGAVATTQVLAAPSSRLMVEYPHPFTSVDNVETFFAANCAMRPVERNQLAQELILNQSEFSELTMRRVTRSAVEQHIATQYRDCMDYIAASISGKPLPHSLCGADVVNAGAGRAIGQYLLYERNIGWVARLPQIMTEERLPFYALGAAHFVDGPTGPGLITMLRDAGFIVSLIENRAQLDAVLRRIPSAAVKPVADRSSTVSAKVLRGKCMTVPNNYICAWGNSETQFNVARVSPDKERLILCSQRDTAWGPQRRCTNVTLPPASQRDQDLLGAARFTPQ